MLDEDPALPPKTAQQLPTFWPMSMVAKRLDGSGYHLVRRPRPRRRCVRWGPAPPQQLHTFRPTLFWHGRPSQLLLHEHYASRHTYIHTYIQTDRQTDTLIAILCRAVICCQYSKHAHDIIFIIVIIIIFIEVVTASEVLKTKPGLRTETCRIYCRCFRNSVRHNDDVRRFAGLFPRADRRSIRSRWTTQHLEHLASVPRQGNNRDTAITDH